jgi:hypothetical protein
MKAKTYPIETLEINQPVLYRLPLPQEVGVRESLVLVRKIEKTVHGKPVVVQVESILQDKTFWVSANNLYKA